jgi:hypothetical protein
VNYTVGDIINVTYNWLGDPNTALWATDQPYGFKWLRVKIVAATNGPDTGDWTVYEKKMF